LKDGLIENLKEVIEGGEQGGTFRCIWDSWSKDGDGYNWIFR